MKKFKRFEIIAGPCAVESEEQLQSVAKFLKKRNISYMRAGAYKPRTSPHDFQGLKEKGIQLLKKVKQENDIKIVTEILDIRDIPQVIKVADIVQIGSRNMQNFPLLTELGKYKVPVLLKRGLSATINEWINSAEYIKKEGNDNIILCERGIRTFETKTRNTLDLSCVPILKKETSYPIIVDPSHAAGRSDIIIPLSRASKAVGADGILIEMHPDPKKALCDGNQSLDFGEFDKLLYGLKNLK